MRKTKLLLALAACPSLLLAAGGIGGDASDEPSQARVQPQDPAASKRARALEYFVRASLEKGDVAKRIQYLQESLQLDPGSEAAMKLLLSLADDEKHRPAIGAGLSELARQNPDRPRLVLLAIEFNYRNGLPIPELLTLLDAATAIPAPEKLAPEEQEIFGTLAGYYAGELVQRGERRKAEERYEQLLANPAIAVRRPLLENAARFYQYTARQADRERGFFGLIPSEREKLQDKRDALLDELEKLDKAPMSLAALEKAASFYLSINRRDTALKLVRNAEKQHTGNPDYEFLLAQVLYRARHYKEALQLADALLAKAPQNPAFLQLRGDAALRSGQFKKAEETADRLLKLRPDDPMATYMKIVAMIYDGRFDAAAQAINQVKDVELQQALYMAMQAKQRKYAELIARLQKLEKKQGDKVTDAVYLSLLAAAEQTRDVKLFEHCWKQLEKLGALDEYDTANSVGYVATVLNVRLDEAEKLIQQAIKAEPENGAYLDSLAWLRYRQGRYREAAELIRDALDSQDADFGRGVVLMHAGEIMEKLGDKKAARAYYEEALGEIAEPEIDPAELKARLEKLKD